MCEEQKGRVWVTLEVVVECRTGCAVGVRVRCTVSRKAVGAGRRVVWGWSRRAKEGVDVGGEAGVGEVIVRVLAWWAWRWGSAATTNRGAPTATACLRRQAGDVYIWGGVGAGLFLGGVM